LLFLIPSSLNDVTCHGAMVFFLSFSTPAAFLHSSLIHGLPAMDGVGPAGSGHSNMFCFLMFVQLVLLPDCHCCQSCCSYGNALKMCQKLSSHESSESLSFPSRKGRWLFSLGAGNVVYHHLLLYVRNWVVSLVGGCCWLLFYLFYGMEWLVGVFRWMLWGLCWYTGIWLK